jgi:hypothetical protein
MKKFTLPFFISAIFLFNIFTFFGTPKTSYAAAGDSVFAGIQVHNINIRFSQANYWDSLIFYYNEGLEHYISATIVLDNATFENVGVRLKGNSSFSHPNDKKGFKINFDEFEDQKWDDLKGVHLNNFWNDPSFLREKIHLDFCKAAGISAPRCNYVRLSLNDTLYAFYSLIEHIDKTFMKTRYGINDGERFKAVDGIGAKGDLFSDFKWYGNDSTEYFNKYELKSDGVDAPWQKLVSLIDTVNHSENLSESFSQKINTDPFYRAMAADIIFGNLDSYLYTGRNFYFYFTPPVKKLDWIVWDVGLSMGGLPGGPSAIETLPLTYVIDDTSRPLFSKVLNTPTLRTEYLMALCNLFSTYYSTSQLYAHIDSTVALIRPFVYEDSRKMFSNAQFETNVTSDITVSGRRIPGIKSFLNLRKNSVQSQLNTLGIDCNVGIVSNDVNNSDSYLLNQNYPNPFNPVTVISYSLPKDGNVNIKVYDNLGKEVAELVNEKLSSGVYNINFKGDNLASGIYYYTLIVNGVMTDTKSMILLK